MPYQQGVIRFRNLNHSDIDGTLFSSSRRKDRF